MKKLKFCLPLPQLSSEYGLATLILRIKLPMLLVLLELLLLEKSIFIIGDSYEEVSACTCAFLDLLKPYKWVSTFIPILPKGMLDIVTSPVPFLVGAVASSETGINDIIADSRVQQEMHDGLSVVNLKKGKVYMTQQDGITSVLVNCISVVQAWNHFNQIHFFQQRLKQLSKKKSSSLSSFKLFFQNGTSPEESLTLCSIRRMIKTNILSLSGVLSKHADGWKKCCNTKPDNEILFVPTKITEQLECRLKFQETFLKTQMVTNYFEDRVKSYLKADKELKEKNGNLIASWLYLKWKAKQQVTYEK